jgi:WD40 repeat protein
MSKKHKNIVVVVAILVGIMSIMIFSSFRSSLVRQLQGPIEGTESIVAVNNKLSVISKDKHIYTWQWKDLAVWPVVAKPQAVIIAPIANDKIIYNSSVGSGKLIITNLKADKELATLSLPFGVECKKIKTSSSGKFGIISMLSNEGVEKDRLKLAVFDSEFKNLSCVFQKDASTEKFLINDFDITDDNSIFAGAGEKDKAWVFAKAIKNEKVLWEKTFGEYGRFTSVKFSPDGKTLFAVEKVRYIISLDSATGSTIKGYEMSTYKTPANQKQNISCIAISPDGKILAADTEPGRIVWFWDIASGNKIGEIYASELTVSGMAFSPDSKYLATGCLVSPEIKIWKVPQLKD